MNNLTNTTIAAILASSLAGGVTHAAEDTPVAEPGRAQLLYEHHCLTCHESTVHVRANRAQNRKILEGWVRRWHKVLSLDWSDQDKLAVTDYLARTYYDFKD